LYFTDRTPYRTVLSVYSLVINGFSPEDIIVFGEHQWSESGRAIFRRFLPFARFVATSDVLARIRSLPARGLADLALQHWIVMKACVNLLYPPDEFCFMDDDVFVLDRTDDAVEYFDSASLVFITDADHGEAYVNAWHGIFDGLEELRTGRFNAGLFWMKNRANHLDIATDMLRQSPHGLATWVWEQGFVACLCAREEIVELPTQRYFYPIFDGLPGGILGYDYAANPCGFAAIHFGGLPVKPSDDVALVLAQEILGRSVT